MDQQKPDFQNQNTSPAKVGVGEDANASSSLTPAPAPRSAPTNAPTPAKGDGKAVSPTPTTDPKKGPAGKDSKAAPRAYRTISNERFVRRRKQKRVALVILSIAATGCFVLGMVAFLGNFSGQFTVKIDPSANLTMDADNDSFDTKTSYLKATGLEAATTYLADSLPEADAIDTTPGGSKNGYRVSENHPERRIGQYMAYTFFVRNVDEEATAFSMRLNIDSYSNGVNGTCSLIDILRVRLFANSIKVDGAETHDFATYANISADGVTPEIVSPITGTKEENMAPATPFVGEKTVAEEEYTLDSMEDMRFTIILWLEPDDPECHGRAPEDAYVSFSMNFAVL
jgi:hypothetical protein